MKIEKEIGIGNEYVYVYYNENDKRLAELENKKRWECKIGFSSTEPIQRIISQGVQTSMAKEPIIGLLIKTPCGYYVESQLHKALYRFKLPRTTNVVGDEWFLTTPQEVEDIIINNVFPSEKERQTYCEYPIKTLKDIGTVLNLHRQKINLKEERLCKDVNTSRDTVWRLFKGNPNISLSTVFNIIDNLGLEITLTSKVPSKDIPKYKTARKLRRSKL